MNFKEGMRLVLTAKPQKLGIEISGSRIILIGYNSRLFRGLNAVLELENIKLLPEIYEEFNTNELKKINASADVKIEINKGVKIKLNNTDILPIGNINRNKKELLKIFNAPLEDFHKINVNNLKLDATFKDFTIKRRELLENNDYGVKVVDINKRKYFIGTNNKVIQLMKMRPYSYEKIGDIKSNIDDYKFPKIIKSIASRKTVNNLYITDADDYILYGTDEGLILFTPKELFKYGVLSIRNTEIDLIEENLNQKNNVIIQLNSIKELTEFTTNNGENLFFNVKDNQLKIKTNTAYRKITEILTVRSNTYKDEFDFAIKTDVLNKILKNKTIKYLTLNYNTTTLVFTDHYNMNEAYNIYLTQTLKNF